MSTIIDFFHSSSGGGDKRVYGVIFDGTNSVGTRLYDSVGLEFEPSSTTYKGKDDFTNGPFAIKECLTTYNPTTGKQEVVMYEGDSGYSDARTNSAYNVMIEFPKFYYKRPSKWEFQVSEIPYNGFLPSPMHYRNGLMHDYVYVSKYKINDLGMSRPNTYPRYDINETQDSSFQITGYRSLANNNDMYLMDYVTWSMLYILMIIKYCDMDCKNAVGCGYTNENLTYQQILINGTTDTVLSKDGYSGTSKDDTMAAIVAFGIENIWGNLASFMDNFYENSGYIYINTNIEDPSSSYEMINTRVNIGGTNFGITTDISYNTNYPWAIFTTNGYYRAPNDTTKPGNITGDGSWYRSQDSPHVGIIGGWQNGNYSNNGMTNLYLWYPMTVTSPSFGAFSQFLS